MQAPPGPARPFAAKAMQGQRRALVVLALGIGGLILLLVLTGELAAFAGAGIEIAPFVVLALLAYAGRTRISGRVLAVLWLAVICLGVTGIALLTTLTALAPDADAGALLGGDLPDDVLRAVTRVGIGAAAGLAVGWLCWLAAVRRALARVLPLDSDAFVHATALVCVVSCMLVLTVPLLVLGDPPLLLSVARDGADNLGGSLRDDVYGLLWTVPAAMLAVGVPRVRRPRQALRRLGLVRPTRGQIALGFAAGALMVVAFALVSAGIAWLWGALGWTSTDSERFGQLLDYATSPVGALVVGITAGLGEEAAIRGVLQPRLGIVLSNLFFTSLHAFQYNFDALLSVFLIGLVLGLIRKRTNTSTSAIAHGTYNFILILLSVIAA